MLFVFYSKTLQCFGEKSELECRCLKQRKAELLWLEWGKGLGPHQLSLPQIHG